MPKLVRFFLDKYGKREGLKDVRITQEALQKLMRYPFPGNVRELENLIEGALALTTDPVVDPGDPAPLLVLLPATGDDADRAEHALFTFLSEVGYSGQWQRLAAKPNAERRSARSS